MVSGTNPVNDEEAFQLEQMLKQIARDVEYSFIRGTYNKPADNTDKRKTRGILAATVTNVLDQSIGQTTFTATAANDVLTTPAAHGYSVGDAVVVTVTARASGLWDEGVYYVKTAPSATTLTLALTPTGPVLDVLQDVAAGTIAKLADITEATVLDLMQSVWSSGGIQEQQTAALMCNGTLKRKLTKIFITDKKYYEQSRNIAGVSVTSIETDFGMLNLMLNRHMPASKAQVVSLEQCAPRVLNIPEKGFLFVEPLAKTGASNKSQIYGEIGLEYGNERAHGKIMGVK